MSPVALITAFVRVLVACGGATIDAEEFYPEPEVISLADGADLPVVANGSPVSLWVPRIGPQLIQDTSLAYGLPTYLNATNGLNGNPGLRVVRDDFPRLMFEAGLYPTADNWIVTIVSSPTSATAIGTTRGYYFGSTALPGAEEGERFIIPHHANDGSANLDRSGWYTDELDEEQPPLGAPLLNRGWHNFYTSQQVAAELIAGPQVNTWAIGEHPFWVRDGVLMGRGLFDSYSAARKRAPSMKCVLFSDHNADLTSTATYLDGDLFYWLMRRGQITVERVISEHAALMARFGL